MFNEYERKQNASRGKVPHGERGEVPAGKGAIRRIVSRCVRGQAQMADQILGRFLTFGHERSPVHSDRHDGHQGEPLQPSPSDCTVYLDSQPGSVRVAVVVDHVVHDITVQCMLTHAEKFSCEVFGIDDPIAEQELKAAALCASNNYLPKLDAPYEVRFQIVGLSAKESQNVRGQLGYGAFAALLSCYYNMVFAGVFFGNVTLLGDLTQNIPAGQELVRHMDAVGEPLLFTAKGYGEQLDGSPYRCTVVEALNADTAFHLLIGLYRGWGIF